MAPKWSRVSLEMGCVSRNCRRLSNLSPFVPEVLVLFSDVSCDMISLGSCGMQNVGVGYPQGFYSLVRYLRHGSALKRGTSAVVV